MKLEVIKTLDKDEYWGVETVIREEHIGDHIVDPDGLILTIEGHPPDEILNVIVRALEEYYG